MKPNLKSPFVVPKALTYCWLAVLASLPGLRTVQSAEPVSEYAVEGHLEFETLNLEGSLLSHQEYTFRVSVRGCKWLMETRCISQQTFSDPIPGMEPLPPPPVTYASDSTNFYELLDVSHTRRSPGVKVLAGRIGPGFVPFGVSTVAMVLWYAYASPCYFQSLDGPGLHPPVPLHRPGAYVGEFRVRGTWALHDNPPYLPQHLTFGPTPRTESVLVGLAHQGVRHLPFTSEYAVEGFAEQAGLSFPIEASWKYSSQDPFNKERSVVTGKIRLRSTNLLGRIAVESFRPRITGPVSLTEMRTISEEHPEPVPVFDATDWPDLDESLARAILIASNPQPIHQPPVRPWIPLALVALLSVPLALMLFWRRTTNQPRIGN